MSSTSLLVIACVLGPAVCLAAAWWCCCVRGQTEHTDDGRNDEGKPVPDDHFQADVEDHAGTLQHHISQQELRALREAQHGQIATSFYEFDADGSGYLDKHEVGAFCQRLGLLLTKAEVAQALSEMETDSTRDSKVDFDEFVAWWASGSRTKQKGTLAFQMQQAKEQAFEAELAGNSPMGRLLAQRRSATPPRPSSRCQMASTPPRDGQSGSMNRRTGTPPRSARTAVDVAQLDPPPLPAVQNEGCENEQGQMVARHARAAGRPALSIGRAQTPPQRVQL